MQEALQPEALPKFGRLFVEKEQEASQTMQAQALPTKKVVH